MGIIKAGIFRRGVMPIGFSGAAPDGSDQPIRSAIYSLERLEEHARSLAAEHRLARDPRRGHGISRRLQDNARALAQAYRSIIAAKRDDPTITPAAEWLADNFYAAEEQLRQIQEDLPAAFYRRLPKLEAGFLAGYPRVFSLAWAFVAHTDSRFDPEALEHFVRAYQRTQPLIIGELWALPITLRVVLVENLRRLAQQVVAARAERARANTLADGLLALNTVGQNSAGAGLPPAQSLEEVRRRFAQRQLERAFVVQLVQRLREEPQAVEVLHWLEQRMTEQGTTLEEVVSEELQLQAAANVSVRNVMTSMRLISAFDWAVFFERLSSVDEILRSSPVFVQSDFATRDRYRHAIEELALGSKRSELEVARRAMALAQAAHQDRRSADGATADGSADGFDLGDTTDPGVFLIGQGRGVLERDLGFRASWQRRLFRLFIAAALPGYLGTIAFILALTVFVGLTAIAQVDLPLRLLLLVLAIIPASVFAIALINSYVSTSFAPRALPKLELLGGVSEDLRTMVVVPTLLGDEQGVREELERLEVRYLANSEGYLHFALLTDFTDAPFETMPEDAVALRTASDGIQQLNERYGEALGGGSRFLLYHRKREWSEGERRWMGWERKRGKLHELNRLLRGANDTGFVAVGSAAIEVPAGVRFVITLDADTRLPRGVAKKLVGALGHPLNRPRLAQQSKRVVAGYAVLQPRVTISLPSEREGTIFQRVFSSHAGIDPYSSTVSDVYQDLFAEGSYTGKGIYDLDAFEAALEGRIPATTMLSHDLFEGLFARAGLLSDVEVVEEYPAHYEVHAARQHRWTRGDWQLLPWIFSNRAPIPLIGRWKMFDNLRRSLIPITAWLALLVGWTVPEVSIVGWTAFVVGVLVFPAVLPVLAALAPPQAGVSRRSYLLALGEAAALALWQVVLTLALLTHQAWLMLDAIGRTLLRLLTRRNLLEWRTAAQSSSGATLDLLGFYQRMAAGVVLGLLTGLLVLALRPSGWWLALPFALAWIVSPTIAWLVSRPNGKTPLAALSAPEQIALRLIARRTWHYFERFLVADDHFLPPDNFQETPQPVIAHRTSPTNIGLTLLSTVTAHDFGWIGLLDGLALLEATLASTRALEGHRGHLFNWYDTQTLAALEPRYVSTVDSGNLAGHLIALAQACREFTENPLLGARALGGIGDAVRLARIVVERMAAARPAPRLAPIAPEAALVALETALVALETGVQRSPITPSAWAACLAELATGAERLLAVVQTLTSEVAEASDRGELLVWANAILVSVRSHQRDFKTLVPWASHWEALALVADDERSKAALAVLQARPAALREATNRGEELLVALAQLRLRPEASSVADSAMGDVAGSALGALAELDRIEATSLAARNLIERLEGLAAQAEAMVAAMDFSFLFNPTRKLFSIGYTMAQQQLDLSCYDLLASEAHLTSFLAIAKQEVPTAHWFHLGRECTPVGRGTALISWSGSMFEYLMPALVLQAPIGSLLAETQRLVVGRQIAYGQARGVPWGISESAYSLRDVQLTYQYSSFGVPGLGLKRGLGDALVVAPYATMLAAMIEPVAALRNLERLEALGAGTTMGFYDALDFTSERLPEGAPFVLVRNVMVHHAGMALVALANVLLGNLMVQRFHRDPRVQSAELLLQERTPRYALVARPRSEEVAASANAKELAPATERRLGNWHEVAPQTHLLSNGRYTVMLTVAGSGFSRWNDLAVTRWREDATCDANGTYIFLRDLQSGQTWSATPQPIGVAPDSFEARFSEGRAEFLRRDGSIETKLEVIVSPEDDAELRRVSIANLGSKGRELELTSYLEVVLASSAADAAHPAFSKLFVQTEFVAALGGLLATRRPRSSEEVPIWAVHVIAVENMPNENEALDTANTATNTSGNLDTTQFETDRARFLGRGRDLRNPAAITDGLPLSGTVGSVLDPIFSLRRRIRLAPGARVRLTFTTLVAPTRAAALELADKYRNPATFERELMLAWTRAQVELHHLGIHPDEAQVFQRLAGRTLYLDPSLRSPAQIHARNHLPQSALWRHGISGDLPMVLVRLDAVADLDLVRQALRAHGYWRTKRLAVDLVILNEQPASYVQELQNAVLGMTQVESSGPGGVFVLRADLLSLAECDQLRALARVVLSGRQGTLAEQVARLRSTPANSIAAPPASAAFSPLLRSRGLRSRPADESSLPLALPLRPLEFDNGLGAFAEDGREYRIVLGTGQTTPAPWINVIANPNIGFTASELGSGYTWVGNSRENKLTPWSNDPVSDPAGEVIYLRDEDSQALFTVTALPIRERGQYLIRHGQGYSVFERQAHGLRLELTQFVANEDPIKISRLVIKNTSTRPRRISVTAYLDWVLGVARTESAALVQTEIEAQTSAIFASNPASAEFANQVAFADLGGRQSAWTTDRSEFIGRNGTLARPAGLEPGVRLSNRTSATEPCAALQTTIELAAGAVVELRWLIGQAASRAAALVLVRRYREANLEQLLEAVKQRWDETLGVVQVRTPDRAMDLLLNRWLLYQTLSSRLWARAGFYQAGGAFGFRDQLQDVMALTVARPELARAQILLAAGHQFLEGDVQHWWHPPSGRGVRTHISDDLIWLPFVISHYLKVTNDQSLLDELRPFLDGPPLALDHEDAYFTPQVSDQTGTVYQHAVRALNHSLALGAHGLPLIGSGDWNDGLNRVGREGKGESVWLAWFLHVNLSEWAKLAESRGELAQATAWRIHVAALEVALETQAWDGHWYKRGFFDDGTPLGSAQNSECKIDAIAQSWAVISGAAPAARAQQAMAAMEQYLVRREDRLLLLFTPPFDTGTHDPGYIKGYLPGVRENGGQYTHAAVWSVIAFALLGDGDKAFAFFSLLNPINHTNTPVGVQRYKVEPYVVAADVYAEAPHVGRGGWSWYTGSSGWFYRAGLEWMLGFRIEHGRLQIDPCIPAAWPGFSISFKHNSSRYEITVENPNKVMRGVKQLELDGQVIALGGIELHDDGQIHSLRVVLG
jgi:cyclic beta-1,2-glucan synthetase